MSRAQHEQWSEEDTYLPLEAEHEALTRIGFAVEVIWRGGPVGVMVEKKTSA
ncbi:MAG: hypothetical protein ABGX07_08160 [Pirellulaceae bacterium]